MTDAHSATPATPATPASPRDDRPRDRPPDRHRASPALRALCFLLAAGILTPLVLLAATAAGAGGRVAWAAAAAVAGVALAAVWFGMPALPRFRGSDRVLLASCVVAFALASLAITATGTFMLDASDQRFAYARGSDFPLEHNCFTCLVVGSQLARHGGASVYDKSRYRGAEGAKRTLVHNEIGGRFSIDGFPYPPPALLPVHVLRETGADFFQLRTYWYVLSVFALLAALLVATVFAGGFGAHRSLLLFPLVLLVPNVLVTLQIGNVQTIVIALTLLGMVAFAKGYDATGAALLAYPILVKIWPAALLLYFLMGRRWRPIFATLVAVLFYALAAFAAFGPGPFVDFFDRQLPLLINGRAFAFMQTAESARLVNMSVFGWPQKLFELGYTPQHSLLPGALKWSYTGFVVFVVALVGWRFAGRERRDTVDRLTAVRTWLALMTLIQLRSPFLPFGYGVLSTICLLLFLLPRGGWFRTILVLIGLLAVSIDVPLFAAAERLDWNRWHVLAGSAVAFLTSVFALLPVVFGRSEKRRS